MLLFQSYLLGFRSISHEFFRPNEPCTCSMKPHRKIANIMVKNRGVIVWTLIIPGPDGGPRDRSSTSETAPHKSSKVRRSLFLHQGNSRR
jgi:hypothetical protein